MIQNTIANKMASRYEDIICEHDDPVCANELWLSECDDIAKHYLDEGHEFEDGSSICFKGRDFVVRG